MNRVKRRAALLHLQGGRCFYCDVEMSTTGADILRMDTFDEVMPRSRGGRREMTNTVLACMACNMAKGNRLPTNDEMQRFKSLLSRDPAYRVAEAKARALLDNDFDDE